MLSLAGWVAVIGVVLLGLNAVVKVVRDALLLREFKGPRWARFSRLWLASASVSKRSSLIFAEVNDTYGVPSTQPGFRINMAYVAILQAPRHLLAQITSSPATRI